MADNHLQTVAKSLFNSITGLRVRPRFCRAEGPSGLHRSPQRGETVEFSEYRPYTPGVELRFLDWKLYARTDRLYVKSFCDERASRFLIVVDDSPSMHYPIEGRGKLDLACELALGLSFLAAHRQKDAVSVVPLSLASAERREEFSTLGSIMRRLQKLSTETETRPVSEISASLARLDLRRPTTVIVLSDLYDEPAAILGLSRRMRRLGHEFWFLQILSKEEIALPYDSLRDFVDLESGQKLQLDPRAIRAHYSRALHEHMSALKSLASHGRYSLAILGHDSVDILKRFLQD